MELADSCARLYRVLALKQLAANLTWCLWLIKDKRIVFIKHPKATGCGVSLAK